MVFRDGTAPGNPLQPPGTEGAGEQSPRQHPQLESEQSVCRANFLGWEHTAQDALSQEDHRWEARVGAGWKRSPKGPWKDLLQRQWSEGAGTLGPPCMILTGYSVLPKGPGSVALWTSKPPA